jgi:hypothetical protein
MGESSREQGFALNGSANATPRGHDNNTDGRLPACTLKQSQFLQMEMPHSFNAVGGALDAIKFAASVIGN